MGKVIDIHSAFHALWGIGCESWTLVNHADLSIKQERMPPHTSEVMHYHQHAKQFFYILKGSAQFYIQDERKQVDAFQGIHIGPGIYHLITNETDQQLEFLVISQPSTQYDRIEI